MKKILAVSGGVDSMVLLHMFRNESDVVVAHFDHGTRPSSKADAEFVQKAAESYGLPFFLGSAELGSDVSEEQARISRYEFFEDLARKLDGEIYTAHHADDLIETMAINIIRGTGWRGLAPFSRQNIRRPFLEGETPLFRRDIYQYASQHGLSFRFDPTNAEDKYLRNRVREKLMNLHFDVKLELIKIYHQMNNLRTEIDTEVSEILATYSQKDGFYKYDRTTFMNLEDATALEILHAILACEDISATRPQLHDFLKAIQNYSAGRKFNLPRDQFAKIGTREFWVITMPADGSRNHKEH